MRCPTRMIPLDAFGSKSVGADLLQQIRWYDGVSCPIKVSQKIASHNIFKRSNSNENSTTNPDE